MRNRFRPNVTPRGSRRSGPSRTSSATSVTEVVPETVEQLQTVEEPTAFIPPNSSKAGESIASPVLESSSGGNQEATSTKESNDPAPSGKPNICPDSTTSSTRRARIKPSVTPSTRTRNKPTSRGSKTTSQETQEICSDTIEITASVEEVISDPASPETTAGNTPSKDANNTINITTEKTSKATSRKSTPQSIPLPETPTEIDKHAGSSVAAAEGSSVTSGSLPPRRKRATPNIGVAARRHHSVSVPPDKGTSQLESPVGQQIDETPDKSISEGDETEERTSKRPRTTPEVLENDIGVIEVTVQNVTPQVQPVEEEIVEEEEEQTNRKVEEKKKKSSKHSRPKEPLDPSKMTLQDLIYFNPKGNPMKSSVDAKRKRIEGKRKSSQSTESENGDASTMDVDGQDPTDQPDTMGQITEDPLATDTSTTEGGDDSRVCAPQVKIGEDGCIILDEESLVIRSATNTILEDGDIVYEDSNNLNYAAYFKQSKRSKWSMPETMKFYKALSQVGTDFSLMVPLFPKRKRKELKAKFKREEKIHEDLVDKALVHRTPISIEMFARQVQTEEEVLNDVIAGNDNESVADVNT